MFEKLTEFLPKLQNDSYGEWVPMKKTDDALIAQYVIYSDTVHDFIKAVYAFIDTHKEMQLTNYMEIIEAAGIELNTLKSEDLESLDGITVTAIIVSVIRFDRFCEGHIFGKMEDGTIKKCLMRLKELDKKV